MPVVMVIAILVVFAVVVLAARGRGSSLSTERGDYVPLNLGPVSATDVALLRPPTGLWGYNMQATDDAMEQIAASIRERDIRIVALEQLVTDLSRDQAPATPLGSPYAGARHRRTSADLYREQAAYGDQAAEPAYGGTAAEPAYGGTAAEPAYGGSAAEPAYGDRAGEAAYPGAAYAETEQSRAEYPERENSETEYPETEPLAVRYPAAQYQEAEYQEADYQEARYPEADFPEAGTVKPGPSEGGSSEAGTALPPEQSHD